MRETVVRERYRRKGDMSFFIMKMIITDADSRRHRLDSVRHSPQPVFWDCSIKAASWLLFHLGSLRILKPESSDQCAVVGTVTVTPLQSYITIYFL